MGRVPMRQLEINDEFFHAGCRYLKTSDLGLMVGIINCFNITEGREVHLSPYTKVVPA